MLHATGSLKIRVITHGRNNGLFCYEHKDTVHEYTIKIKTHCSEERGQEKT